MKKEEDITNLLAILSRFKPSEQVIFLNLYARAADKKIFASHANLVAWTGIKSRNTVKTGIRKLESKGLLTIKQHGKEGSPSLFLINSTVHTKEKEGNNTQKMKGFILNTDNMDRFLAVKKGLSPGMWESIKKESQKIGLSEEQIIIDKFFGPMRLENKTASINDTGAGEEEEILSHTQIGTC